MAEKTDWEVIDVPQASEHTHFSKGNTLQQLMNKLLGPWWRWKLAGIAVVGALAVMVVAALSLMFVALIAAGAVIALLLARVRQWWYRGKHQNDHTHTSESGGVVVRTVYYKRQ